MAKVIARLCRELDGVRTIASEDVYEESPMAASGFHYVRILRTPEYREFWVASSTGAWVPHDGKWIREAVAKKADHQVDILIVDGGLLLDDEQISAFSSTFDPTRYGFTQLWVLTGLRAIRLK